MRVIVILGRVLDPSGMVVKGSAGRIFVNREEYLIQPADRCALEAALRIKDGTDAEVIALPRGPLPDDDILRQAIAIGADRAIYLTGAALKQADEAAMASALTAAIERLGGADLVLTGSTTLDTGQGQLGPRLAEALDAAQITGAWEVSSSDGRVQAILQQNGGYVTVEADLPAVVTLLPGALKLRYPDGVRLINVYRGEGEVGAGLETWDAAELVDETSLKPLVESRGKAFAPERERGVRVSGTSAEMAQAAANALRQRMQR